MASTTTGSDLTCRRLAPPLADVRISVPVGQRHVRRRDLLGGLIHEYYGAAA
jgi:hypothetical protein